LGLSFGERLKGARNNAGFTQQQLADRVGVKRKQIISNWEKGITEPSFKFLLRIAIILDESLDYLVGHLFKAYKDMSLEYGDPGVDVRKTLTDLGVASRYIDDAEDFVYFMLFKSYKDAHTVPHADDEDLEGASWAQQFVTHGEEDT
jgi:transcriptional regulator with XRE-family HTH domain